MATKISPDKMRERAQGSYHHNIRDARIGLAEALHILSHYNPNAQEMAVLRDLVGRVEMLENSTLPF